MKKLLFIIAVLLSFGVHAQTFTPIHNYQAPDGLDVVKFLGIPYGATPTLNGINRPSAHPLYYKTTDSSLYLYTGSQWIRVGGGNGNKDTVLVDEGLGVRFDSLGYQHLFAIHPDGYEGGIVTYAGTGFDFNVSPITLYLNNKVFLFPEKTITLSPPNSLPRYDIFGVDSLGAFVKSGDTSALPIEPQIGVDSFALTKAFLISPGDTAPSNITTVIIYDQNTEWTTGTQGSISVVNFDNTDNPLHLTKDIFISKYNNNSKIYFVNGSYVSTENTPQSVLLLPIYLNAALPANNNIYIRLYDTLTSSTNLYRLGSNDNFNKNEVNAYQTVVIPTSNFTWVNNKSTFTTLLVTFTGYDTSGANGLYMDYIRLQKGLFQTGNGSCPLCIVDIHVTADSTQQIGIRQNGDTAFVINWTGGVSQSTISDTLNNYANSGSISTDNVVYSTPIALSVSNHLLSGSLALKSQSPYTVFRRDGGTGAPSFGTLDTSYFGGNWYKYVQSSAIPVITKNPLYTIVHIAPDLYDTLAVSYVNNYQNGVLDSTNFRQFSYYTDSSFRTIDANNLGNSPGYSVSNPKGLILRNNAVPIASNLVGQSSPAIFFRTSSYHNVSSPNVPAWLRFYGNSDWGSGVFNPYFAFEYSGDSTNWTRIGTIDYNGLNFTNARIGTITNIVTLISGATPGFRYQNGVWYYGNNSTSPLPYVIASYNDTTKGFLIPRGSTYARQKWATTVSAGSGANSVQIINGGSGYTSSSVSFSGGHGSFLSGSITQTGGVVQSVNINTAGNFYKYGDTVTIIQGGNSTATFRIIKLAGDSVRGAMFYDTTINRLYTWQGGNNGIHNWTYALDSTDMPPKIVASVKETAQTTSHNILTYTTGSVDSTFEVGGRITVTSVSGGSVLEQVTWTDETNISRTKSFYSHGSTTAALSTTDVSSFPPITIRAKAFTTITISTVVTGTVTYNDGAYIKGIIN